MYNKIALFLIMPLAITGCATTSKIHPDFAKRHEHMQNIALLPSNIEVYEVTFNAGNKPLSELQEYVDAKSSASAAETFEEKGYQITKVKQSDIDNDPKIKEAWFNIQTLYKQALQDIAKNKKPNFTYEVGSGPNVFADKYQAHAIILMRQTGTKLSQGVINAQLVQNMASIATTLLVGVPAGGGVQPWWTLTTEIAVVDAESGDILWYNLGLTTDDYTDKKKEQLIPKHVKDVLKMFPDSKFKKPEPPQSKKDKEAVLVKPEGSNFGPVAAAASAVPRPGGTS